MNVKYPLVFKSVNISDETHKKTSIYCESERNI